MKIVISSTGKDLDSQIDPRFGRCQYFIFVNPDSMEFETAENAGVMASGGAGVQATQLIAQKGANALITGNLGPNAASAISASGIKVYLVAGGTVREVTEAFKMGSLRETSGPTVPPTLAWEEAAAWVEVA